jgi:hypothetical protein
MCAKVNLVKLSGLASYMILADLEGYSHREKKKAADNNDLPLITVQHLS